MQATSQTASSQSRSTTAPARSAPSRLRRARAALAHRRARRRARARRAGDGVRPHPRRAALRLPSARHRWRRPVLEGARLHRAAVPHRVGLGRERRDLARQRARPRHPARPRSRRVAPAPRHRLRAALAGLGRRRSSPPATWRYGRTSSSFDALHTIAIALLAASLVLALPWTRREQAWAFGGARAPLRRARHARARAARCRGRRRCPARSPRSRSRRRWAGPRRSRSSPGRPTSSSGRSSGSSPAPVAARSAAAMALVGAVLVAATFGHGRRRDAAWGTRSCSRSGAASCCSSSPRSSRFPPRAAARVAPIGRASLGVYAIHVPIVYGWSTLHRARRPRRVRTSASGAALLVAAAVLAASFALHVAFQQAWRSAAAARALARRSGSPLPRERLGPARRRRGRVGAAATPALTGAPRPPRGRPSRAARPRSPARTASRTRTRRGRPRASPRARRAGSRAPPRRAACRAGTIGSSIAAMREERPADAGEVAGGRRARPVVLRRREAVQRRGDGARRTRRTCARRGRARRRTRPGSGAAFASAFSRSRRRKRSR